MLSGRLLLRGRRHRKWVVAEGRVGEPTVQSAAWLILVKPAAASTRSFANGLRERAADAAWRGTADSVVAVVMRLPAEQRGPTARPPSA